jgi:hypothetical protein
MSSKSTGRIVVGGNGENPILCFSVEPETGTSGTQKQFIDIEVSREQLKDLARSIEALDSEEQE